MLNLAVAVISIGLLAPVLRFTDGGGGQLTAVTVSSVVAAGLLCIAIGLRLISLAKAE
jgi:hypothetical protein